MSNQIDDAMQFQQKVLNLRAYRQEVLAANIANADTPNYKARDIDFKAALQSTAGAAQRGGALPLARTAAAHLGGSNAHANAPAAPLLYRTEMQSSVDGNTVNIDTERAAFAENAVQYEASLTFVSHLMRDIQSALQSQ